MKHFIPPKVPLVLRWVDRAMVPIMFLLGGFHKDAMQETHPWHAWRGFNPKSINRALAVEVRGTDRKTFSRHFLFLFHAPVLGGWKDYTVLAPEHTGQPFHIGWVVYEGEVLKDFGIQKLPITNGPIRMLNGTPRTTTHFFAVGQAGAQLKLCKQGSGRLGDKAYPGTRLF